MLARTGSAPDPGVLAEDAEREGLAGHIGASRKGRGATDLAALDAWIARQPEPKPSRPEAIRQILAAHLKRAS